VWTMASFPYDRSLTSMSAQFGIAVRDDGDDIEVDGDSYDTTQVESDADEASGASGSPLFAWWDGSPYAIGVHHGVERDGTISGTEIYACASGGDGFTQATHWARGLGLTRADQSTPRDALPVTCNILCPRSSR
jgi:hypothetical protein